MLKFFKYLFSSKGEEDLFYSKKLKLLSKKINIKFRNKKIFLEALTHRSFIQNKKNNNLMSNERLEYLGDSVLNLIVTDYLFSKYHEEDEGYLTKMRSQLVNKDNLTEIAKYLSLEDYLLISENAKISLKHGATSIISDAIEALIGAIYLDSGYDTAKNFVINLINKKIENPESLIDRNYKSQLLELVQAKKIGTISYNLDEEIGPEHSRIFKISLLINDKVYGVGYGKTKKQAEQEAAFAALKLLNENNNNLE